jgi:hypothetical protein
MKKVLIITYYWPPAGGVGVLRWLKFVKYLRDYGWEPVVFTVGNGEYADDDASLLDQIPQGVEIIRQQIWEPYSLYKRWVGASKDSRIKVGFTNEGKKPGRSELFSRWVRGNLFIPDARAAWIRPGRRFMARWLRDNPVDIIVSTGPPHSTHLIAKGLASRTNIPWVADFRDPWTDISYFKDLRLSAWARRRHYRLERSVLASADDVIVVGPYMAERFWKKFRRRYRVISNGYDESDFPGTPLNARSPEFILSHVGSISPSQIHPLFWEALGELAAEQAEFSATLQIRLVGNVDTAIIHALNSAGLEQKMVRIPHLSHQEALKEMSQASLLLLFINQVEHAQAIITGKVFEYLMLRRPILCMGPLDGDAANIIRETESGKVFDGSDKQAIKNYILDQFIKWQAGESFVTSKATIKAYSRKSLTRDLADALNLISSDIK